MAKKSDAAEERPVEGEGAPLGPEHTYPDLAPPDLGPDGPAFDIGSATSTAPSSLTSGFKLAKQTAKGTAATTGFTIGRLVESAGDLAFDMTTQADEHFYATNLRATSLKSQPRRVSHLSTIGFRGYVHPEFIGFAMLGLGYTATTTGAGANKSHAFVLANRNLAPWLTGVARVGEGSNILERRYTDMRVASLNLTASATGLIMEGGGYALYEEALGAATATATTEPDAMILPSDGTLTGLVINSEPLLSPIRGMTLQFSNQLDTRELRLWNSQRADLAIVSQAASGVIRGIDLTLDVYNLIKYGNKTSGATPSLTSATGSLAFSFEAAVDIPTTVIPYSIAFNFPNVTWTMNSIRSSGSNLVRFDLAWAAVDDGSASPWTVTLVNAKTSY